MKRTAIYAHFDARDEVKAYVEFYLKALHDECERVIFVSTSKLPEEQLAKVHVYCKRVLLRENVGMDFGMWQAALAELDLSDTDELLLVNSSTFGPIYALKPIFERMTNEPCDFWGMTDNFEIAWHLQSYFLLLKRSAFTSERFREFFRSVLPYHDKDQIIRSYEVGMTRYLQEGGLVGAALVPMAAWVKSDWRKKRLRRKRHNATVYYPMQLLRLGMPLVKIQLLRDNPRRLRLKPVLQAMAEAGYDISQVQF